MFIIGACIGSFLCCQARRLHLKEEGEKKLGSRSICLSCKHKLKWYENIPVISWLILRGKCKKCGRPIGLLEIFSETSVAIAFLITTIAFTISIKDGGTGVFGAFSASNPTIDYSIINGFNLVIYILTLIFISVLAFLAIYDSKWGELPTKCLITAIIISVVIAILKIISIYNISGFKVQPIIETISSLLILGGIYLLLYLISKGKWVGDGDWLLASAIGLAIGLPFDALLLLFIANFSACIVMWPAVHKTKNHKIYFGPFLVFAYVIIVLCISLKVIL